MCPEAHEDFLFCRCYKGLRLSVYIAENPNYFSGNLTFTPANNNRASAAHSIIVACSISYNWF